MIAAGRRRALGALAAAALGACAPVDGVAVDDGAAVDVGVSEVGGRDAGAVDAGVTDAGAVDGGAPDAGAPDAGVTDAGVTDAGATDAGVTDAGVTDAAAVDGGAPDAAAVDGGAPTEPLFTAIPWSAPGFGVAYRDGANPRGDDVFIGYAGYAVTAAQGQAWVTALYTEALRDRGVRHVYAVQGPRESDYRSQEIGNSRLIAHLLPRLAPGARVLVAAHSSGGFVASELFQQLYARGLDPAHLTRDRLSYWDLDGATAGLTAAIVGQMRHAWFVWSLDATTGTRSPNAGVMIAAGAAWGAAGGALSLDASGAGCNRGAAWCVHMHLVTTRPHDPATSDVARDYTAFDATHRVQTAWLTRTGFGAP